jgi:hypothetical protein
MKNNTMISQKFNDDKYPIDEYYTLEDLINFKGVKSEKITKIPKKKRTPITRDSNDEDTPPKKVVKENNEEVKSVKKPKKSYQITFNKSAKTIIEFIVNRFLWEVYSIEDYAENCPDTGNADISEYILQNVPLVFDKSNITELIIHSVNSMNPKEHMAECFGLDVELRNKYDIRLQNANLSNVAAMYVTDFLKLIAIYTSNKFWLEKTRTVSKDVFQTIMRFAELSIPAKCNTVSNGLWQDIDDYDIHHNPIQTEEKNAERAKNKTANKTSK